MKEENKKASKIDFNKVKDVTMTVFKKIGLVIKRLFVLLVKFIKKLSKIKVGKYFNGAHVLFAVIALILIFIGLSNSNKEIAYPVIYNNGEGDLYLIDKDINNEENAIKLGNGEYTNNVKYANTTDRYILFQKNESLYLYDSKEKGETTKILSNVQVGEYYFTDDDKYVVALDEDNNLMVYDFKDTTKLDKDVSQIVVNENDSLQDKVMYIKEKVLYVKSINPKKNDRLKVSEEYDSQISLSEDKKNVIYIDNDKTLHMFNIKKDNDEVIAKKVSSYYCDDKSCNKMFFIQNDDRKSVYYYNGKDTEVLSKDIYSLHAWDVDKKQVVFSRMSDKKYTLYYQKLGSDAVEIEDNITSLRSVKLFNGKDIYFVTSDNELKYAQINGSKINGVKSIGEDVTGYLIAHKKGYVFVGDVENSKGVLYLAKGGKTTQIDENVTNGLITVSNDGKNIYYLKDYKTTGDLYVSKNGRKGKLIDKDVYNYEYVKDNLIYLIKDYSVSKSRGDLYRYTNKSVLIAEDITRIADISTGYEAE